MRRDVFLLSFLFAIFLAAQKPPPQKPSTRLNFRFENVTRESGVRFQHENGASPEMYLPETMGAGCGWLDYDGDGLLDLLFVQSGPTPAFKPAKPLRLGLYRNQGGGKFEEATKGAGLDSPMDTYGMGVAVGDYNNDGKPDIYVTGFPKSHLYQNIGGKFVDVTDKAGVANNGHWAASAAWFDYDNDGLLDLFVANYLDWDYSKNVYCGEHKPGYRSYCAPTVFGGVAPTLYHNNGDGTFTDVTKKAGLAGSLGKGLGVVAADYNNDGRMDILQSNDSVRNFLFRNNGDGTFSEVGVEAGLAYGEEGRPEAGMGIDVSDYDHRGVLGVYITHLDMELHRLFHNSAEGEFTDSTYAAQMAKKSNVLSGFGTKFVDVNNDGWPDILQINGHILPNIHLLKPTVEYAEPKTMWLNGHNGTFQDVSSELGKEFMRPTVGRGLCIADFDNDGTVDFAVSNNGGPAELWRNHIDPGASWIAFTLVGTKSNRDGIGTRITVRTGTLTQFQQKSGGGSYLSSSDPRVFFGLGDAHKVDSVDVMWPSGRTEKFKDLTADQFVILKEGAGIVGANDGAKTKQRDSSKASRGAE